MLLGKVLKILIRSTKELNLTILDLIVKKLNDIFFAISGNNFDGRNYIKEAIKNGARVIVSNLKFQEFNKDNVLFIYNKNQENYYQKYQVNFIN